MCGGSSHSQTSQKVCIWSRPSADADVLDHPMLGVRPPVRRRDDADEHVITGRQVDLESVAVKVTKVGAAPASVRRASLPAVQAATNARIAISGAVACADMAVPFSEGKAVILHRTT
jgi:hypothetical protein